MKSAEADVCHVCSTNALANTVTLVKHQRLVAARLVLHKNRQMQSADKSSRQVNALLHSALSLSVSHNSSKQAWGGGGVGEGRDNAPQEDPAG